VSRNRMIWAALAVVVLVAGGIGAARALNDGGHDAAAMHPASTSPSAEQQMALGDQEFIRMMIPHHQMAMEMAELALTRAEHPQVRRLARSIVRSQGAEVGRMRAWYRSWFGGEPAPMDDPMHMGMGMSLEELARAKPFDRAFLAEMIPHHASAIVMASELEPVHPPLGRLAAQITAAQAGEIGTMQRWRQTWYPPLG
jgi:uncharacterized protein (DUF305 family)